MKKLRLKIVLGVLASATLVFALTILILGISANYNLNTRSDAITDLIDSNGGELPPIAEYRELNKNEQAGILIYNEESPYRIRYFYVTVVNDNIMQVNTEHIAAVDEKDAVRMTDAVMHKKMPTGSYDDYRYRVSATSGRVVFLDCSEEINTIRTLMALIFLIALGFIMMITVVFYFLSKRIVRPFEENAKMQKQFITDASHELKTPLAIISANAEVLAYKDGENEWITNITTQVTRISELVNELLTLNRLEEIGSISDIEPVDLSEIVNRTADEFEEVFNSRHITLTRMIRDNVVINGNPGQLKRLSSVLTENASKYAEEGGEVIITLRKETRHTFLTVFNTCEIAPDTDYKHLFDRFYRPDSSRTSSTGGHGVGLSIAKRIAAPARSRA